MTMKDDYIQLIKISDSLDREFIKQWCEEAYKLSRSFNMGLFQYIPGDPPKGWGQAMLSRIDADKKFWEGHRCILSLDWEIGRCMKLYIFQNDRAELVVKNIWPDHYAETYRKLFQACGLPAPDSLIDPHYAAEESEFMA